MTTVTGGLEWVDPTDLDGVREALKLADPEGRLASVGMSRVAVLDRLGVPARETLLVGDRLATDARMTNEAGMAGALVLSGATTLDEALNSGDRPDHVIKSLGELLPGAGELRTAAQAPDSQDG
jgi:hypothetical protein